MNNRLIYVGMLFAGMFSINVCVSDRVVAGEKGHAHHHDHSKKEQARLAEKEHARPRLKYLVSLFNQRVVLALKDCYIWHRLLAVSCLDALRVTAVDRPLKSCVDAGDRKGHGAARHRALNFAGEGEFL